VDKGRKFGPPGKYEVNRNGEKPSQVIAGTGGNMEGTNGKGVKVVNSH